MPATLEHLRIESLRDTDGLAERVQIVQLRLAADQVCGLAMQMIVRRYGWLLGMVAFTAAFLLLWQLAVQFGIVNKLFVATPIASFGVVFNRLVNGDLLASVAATSGRMILGWLLASLVGILLGALIGSARLAQDLLMPTLEALRPLPASAIIPVAILLFGLNDSMSVAVVAFGSLWPVLLATIYGFRSVPPQLREVGDMLEMGKLRYFFTIALPSASLDILPGLKIGLGLSLILTVVTEMQASLGGVGYDIFMAQRSYRSADLYAGLITIGAIGFLINQVLLIVERRLFAWAPR